MKTYHLLPLLLAATLSPVWSAEDDSMKAVEAIGMLPKQRQATKVPLLPDEKNPFAERSKKQETIAGPAEDAESQENKIRRLLTSLLVTGYKSGDGGRRVLIDNIIAREGQELEPVLADQTEKLIVSSITDKFVEIAWQETSKDASQPRILRLPIKVKPAVGTMLKGQGKGKGAIVYMVKPGMTEAAAAAAVLAGQPDGGSTGTNDSQGRTATAPRPDSLMQPAMLEKPAIPGELLPPGAASGVPEAPDSGRSEKASPPPPAKEAPKAEAAPVPPPSAALPAGPGLPPQRAVE